MQRQVSTHRLGSRVLALIVALLLLMPLQTLAVAAELGGDSDDIYIEETQPADEPEPEPEQAPAEDMAPEESVAAPTAAATQTQLEEEIAQAIANGSGEVEIAGDIALGSAIVINGPVDLTLRADSSVTITAASTRHILVNANNVSLTFENVILDGDGTGGGINAESRKAISVDGAVIQNVYANEIGGGIRAYNSDLTLTNSEIKDNTATNGAGIYVRQGNLIITDTVIENNGNNGVYAITNADVTMENTVIRGNSGSSGGGLYMATSDLDAKNVTFADNTASARGGGLFANASCNVYLEDSTFTDNQSVDEGGAIYVSALDRLQLRGDTAFSGNTSDQGGRYLTDDDDAALHAEMVDATVTWTTGYSYVYNNHDVNYANGDTEPPEVPVPEGKIVDEDTLIAALEAGLATGTAFELPIAVNEIVLTEALVIDQDADITFTVDPEPIEDVAGGVTITAASSRHIQVINPDVISATVPVTITFDGVKLDGGGTGGGISVDRYSELTVNGAVIENCYSSGSGGAITVSAYGGLSITDGVFRDNEGKNNGGAVYLSTNTSLTIRGDVEMTGNTTNLSGGGLYALGEVDIDADMNVSGNMAGNSGGGIYLYGSIARSITGTIVLDGNTALSSHGGGLYVSGGSLTMSGDITVTDNTSASMGGGIYSTAVLTLSDAVITGNTAAASGGGLQCTLTLTLNDTVIEDNTAGTNGGGLWLGANTGSAPTTLTNVVVSGNEAAASGGGLYNSNVDATVTDSEITGNTAVNGGGAYATHGSSSGRAFTFVDSQITGNAAEEDGGGIYIVSLDKLHVRGDSEFAGNVAAQGYYLVDTDHAELHAQQIDDTVTWHESYDYAYNNHDIVYTDGETQRPEDPFKIVDDATLRQAWNEGMAGDKDEIILPIAADEIVLSTSAIGGQALRITRAVTVKFTIDEDFTPAGDSVTIKTVGSHRHIESSSSMARNGELAFTFDGVVLDGGGVGGVVSTCQHMLTSWRFTGRLSRIASRPAMAAQSTTVPQARLS